MSTINNRFILLPDEFCTPDNGLRHSDSLIYLSIRSFRNTSTSHCFPSLNVIAERSGVSKQTVLSSIERLTKAGLLEVEKADRLKASNKYHFKDSKSFLQIPFEVFELQDLSLNEKSILVCLRKCFDSQSLQSFITQISDISLFLGLTYKQVYNPIKALIAKGYISRSKIGRVDVLELTEKVNWRYRELPKPVSKSSLEFKIEDGRILITSVPIDDEDCTSMSTEQKLFAPPAYRPSSVSYQ